MHPRSHARIVEYADYHRGRFKHGEEFASFQTWRNLAEGAKYNKIKAFRICNWWLHQRRPELSYWKWKDLCQSQPEIWGKFDVSNRGESPSLCQTLRLLNKQLVWFSFQATKMFEGEFLSLETIYPTNTVRVPKPIKVSLSSISLEIRNCSKSLNLRKKFSHFTRKI